MSGPPLSYTPNAGGNQSTNSIQQAEGPYVINVGIKQVVGQQQKQNFWNSISSNNNNTNISGTTVSAPYLSPIIPAYSLYLQNNLYVKGTIYGTVVAPSDKSVKENIEKVDPILSEKLMNLKPQSYSYINDENHYQHFGFIAQDVEKEIPSLIYEHNDPVTNDKIKAVNYVEIIPLLLLKIKEQQKEIDVLKASHICILREINEIKGKFKK